MRRVLYLFPVRQDEISLSSITEIQRAGLDSEPERTRERGDEDRLHPEYVA